MNAVVQSEYGSSEVLRLTIIDRPVPGPDEVLIRVHAAGLDPGVWHLMTGLPYLIRIMGYGLTVPKHRIPGHDVAGEIEMVGRHVTRFARGDQVVGVCRGAFAEFACARQDEVVIKPPHVDFVHAAAVPTSAVTALQGLRDVGGVRPGHRVLIIGAAGGVVTFAIQIAKASGASVTGVCSTAKADLVRSLGADEVIDYTQRDFTTDPQRYDLVLDAAGNRPLTHLRRVLTPAGTLVIVGGEGGGRWLGGVHRQLHAIVLAPWVRHRLRTLLSSMNAADLHVLGQLLGAGKIRSVIDRTYPLRSVPDAIRYLRTGHARGKIVITIREHVAASDHSVPGQAAPAESSAASGDG